MKSTGRRIRSVLSLSGVWASVACGVYYLHLLAPYMTNDLYWPSFGLHGAHTYLLDLYRVHLWTTSNGSIDAFDASNTLLKQYDMPSTMLEVQSSYPREILLTEQTSLRAAVEALPSLTTRTTFQIHTQYCWVDLDQRWELAHTQVRQERCNAQYVTNAAMYLELLLRNVNWSAFLARFESSFMFSVGHAVVASPGGAQWLQSVPNARVSVDDEVAFWAAHGLTHFTMQWSNVITIGMHETIAITNAFGRPQELSTTNIAYASRGALWTTVIQNWLFFNDLWASSVANGSLVRSAPNFMANNSLGPSMTVEFIVGAYPFTAASIIVHDALGPFGSVDIFLIAPPASVRTLVTTYQDLLVAALAADTQLLAAFKQWPSMPFDAAPISWRGVNRTYFGGSPMCIFGAGSTFVQPSFLFQDTCSGQKPAIITVQSLPRIFAATATCALHPSPTPHSICNTCESTRDLCVSALQDARAFTSQLPLTIAATLQPLLLPVINDVASLGVELIQFAILNNSNNIVLRQPLLGDDWSFFGFVMLYEWVYGYREVVSFQGDVATFVLISEPIESQSMQASSLEVPASTCYYLWYISVATTVMLVVVACATSVYTILGGCQLDGWELLRFNRVVGPVWIGRPMLLVRAVTALVVLSTPSMAFESSGGIGRFVFTPRSFLDAAIISGETTWLTYVITDVLLVFSRAEIVWSASLSSGLVWVTTLTLELWRPIRPILTVNRSCLQVAVTQSLECTSGVVRLGSTDRMIVLALINGLCNLFVLGCIRGYALWQPTTMPVPRQAAQLLLSAASDAFFSHAEHDVWSVSPALGCMSGLLTFEWRGRRYLFDTKLWLFFRRASAGPQACATSNEMMREAAPTEIAVGPHTRTSKTTVLVGVIYVACSVAGSLSYLQLSSVNLANDMFWVTFNSTGMQSYIANWYNRYVWLTPTLLHGVLDSARYASLTSYASNSTAVTISKMLPRRMHFEVASRLAPAIHGLRQTDPCLVPWIATQYCWLDLERRWDMANSVQRQARCEKLYLTNAAVYLEAPLRNLNWQVFAVCWGTSFDMAFGSELQRDASGRAWLRAVQANDNSETEEMRYWQSKGLASFTAQWQNYKTVGMTNTFRVTTAFGLSYPFTLQASNGSFTIASQTSMKMYWSFASDLWAVATNGSGITGQSLLRSSAHFAFANATPEAIYFINGTLSAPLDPAYAVFHSEIGAFGSVDLRHIPAPASLTQLVRDVQETLHTILTNTTDGNGSYIAQAAYARLTIMNGIAPVPSTLDHTRVNGAGSNLFCNALASSLNLTNGLSSYFGVDVPCNTGIGEWVYFSPEQVFLALVASGAVSDAASLVPRMCSVEMAAPAQCRTSLFSATAFLHAYIPSTWTMTTRTQARSVQEDIAALQVELVTYAQDAVTRQMSLFHQPILDPNDVPMLFVGWTNAYDWAVGTREVVAFEGDVRRLSVISAAFKSTSFVGNAAEVPVNVVAYLRVFCQYISLLMLMVACTVLLYTLLNGLSTEGVNLLKINRVGGIVWVGRQLLFLRSVTALCILSTATLQLHTFGRATFPIADRLDVSASVDVVSKILAAGELGWLGYIFDDICMVFTQQYAGAYASKSSLVVWIIAAILSLTMPVAHGVSLDINCEVVTVDYQVACSSGIVAIGSISRLLLLVGISLGVSMSFYAYHRLRYTLPAFDERTSYMLPCGAKYLFRRHGWVVHRVYYLDYASAAMAGLLVLPLRHRIYVFDVKAWRIRSFDATDMQDETKFHPAARRLAAALPLID